MYYLFPVIEFVFDVILNQFDHYGAGHGVQLKAENQKHKKYDTHVTS